MALELKKSKSTGELMRYTCGWCGYKFERRVGTACDGKRTVGSQVQCKKCRNFIPTWGGKKKLIQ